MALPNQPWTTSYPGAQDTVGSEQPNLTPDSAPGAGDGHRVLVSHMHSLRDKLQSVAEKLGDDSLLPVGSIAEKVDALESAPPAHASSHQNGGADEVATVTPAADAIPKADGTGKLAAGWIPAAAPAAHATSHENGGGDEISIAGLSGLAADAQTPTSHASSHNAGGGDAMAIDAVAGTGSLRTLGTTATSACAGNDARLSDARTPTAHATSHENGGGDEISIAGLSGKAADDQNADSIRTTTGPTLMVVGAVADGEYLRRVGATVVGGAGGSASPLTTKGDLYTYDTGDQRLPVGADGLVLTADSAEATGLKWAAGGGGFPDPVGSAVKYFIDGTAGSDVTGDGAAWGTAFATFDHVWNNVIPPVVRDRYLIEFRNAGALSDAGPNGGYHGDKIFMGSSAGIAIMGETTALAAGAASTTGFFGNTIYYISDSIGGFTPNALVGKWIRMTSGPAAGDIRQIVRNDSAGFYFNQVLSAAPTGFGGDGWEYVTLNNSSNIEGDFAISVQAESGGYGVKFDMLGHTPGVAGDRIKVYGVDAEFRTVYQANGILCEADHTKNFGIINVPLDPTTGDNAAAPTILTGTGCSLTNDGDLRVTGYTAIDMVGFSAKYFEMFNCKVTGQIGGGGATVRISGIAGDTTDVKLALISDTHCHGGYLSNFMVDGANAAAGSDCLRIQRSKIKWITNAAAAYVAGVFGYKRNGIYLEDHSQLLINSSVVGLGGSGFAGSNYGLYARWGSQVRVTSTFLNAIAGTAGEAAVYSGTGLWANIQTTGTSLVDPVEFCVVSVDDMWADSWD